MPYRWGFCTSLSCLLRIIRWGLAAADGILCWWFLLKEHDWERCALPYVLPESQRWWLRFVLYLSSFGEGKSDTWVTSDWNINFSRFLFISCWYHFPSIIVPIIGLPLYHKIRVLPSNKKRCALLIRLPTLIYPNMFMLEAVNGFVDVMGSIGYPSVPMSHCHDISPTEICRSSLDSFREPLSCQRCVVEGHDSLLRPYSAPVLPLFWR